MGTFEKREKNGVTWLSATPFEKMEGIVQGFSTRLGGVSTEHLSSMNLSFRVAIRKKMYVKISEELQMRSVSHRKIWSFQIRRIRPTSVW